ncbi:MAG: SUMF1/EgtB/PvdO family nonheme iron enzyme, partial [Rhodothermales bacterium]
LLPEIERLAQGGNYFEAYTLAVRAERRLKDDSTLARWWPHIADNLTITTEPEGVRVFLQRFAPDAQGTVPAPEYVGVTPLDGLRVARADYHVRLEKEGYAPVERIASREFTPAVRLEAALLEADQVPDDMVFVPGGAYRLVGWGLPTMDEVPLDDYFIDQYEVSNSEYKAFIEAGGYRNRDYWNHPFVKDGQRLSWEEALELFTDRTGLPGPRTWVSQEFPEAEGDHPVTNITWYEAAAYAAFVGKRLPTVFQWEKTARNGAIHPYGIIMPWGLQLPQETTDYRANFDGNRPVAVDSFSFGVSPFGAYNMAGNVKEWCLNEIAGGHATTGGSWEDPQYLFARYGSFSSFHTSRALGFRCVRTAAGATGDQGALRIDLDERTPSYTPVDEATFNSFLSHYQYDKRPLNARIVETQETADWTRETVAFAGVDDDEILAYLYLPRQAAPPYQCINFVDADPMFWGFRSPTVDVEQHFAAHIRAGRALLAVVPKGGLERPREPGYRQPQKNTVKFRELVAHWAAEFSLGLDYLATRDDIDMDRVAYLGTSAGNFRIIFAAVEPRYRSVVLMGGGLRPAHQQRLPEANPINFAPRIQGPTLVINGRHDEVEPVETHVRPLYALLAGPKRLELVDGGHVPPAERRVPVINAWLDETLGPVSYK